ncbi:MAG: hypothetical protein KAT35_00320, partial [Candidatus Aenigmarchaeota archaeon]|nr:hypothetical protein [Candidatus Aenigmarchaeota archaeon]
MIDIYSFPDEPAPIDTLAEDPRIPDDRQLAGCSLEGQDPCTFIYPVREYRPPDIVNLEDYIWGKNGLFPWPPFFGCEEFSEEYRLRDMVWYFMDIPVSDPDEPTFRPGKPIPLFINHFVQVMEDPRHWDVVQRRNMEIWAAFMQYCHYFSVDIYPDVGGAPLSEIATYLDEMHQARQDMWRGEGVAFGYPFELTRPDWWASMRQWRLPKLWFVLRFGDWWGWEGYRLPDGTLSGQWHNDFCEKNEAPRCPRPEEYVAMTY